MNKRKPRGNTMLHRTFDFHFDQFKNLQEAFIDASSMIYAGKAGFFELLQDSIVLYTLPEMITETGVKGQKIRIISCDKKDLSNDQKLILCAIKKQLPVISEDKSILMKAKKLNLSYYNILMILNCLLFRKEINQEKYLQYLSSLKKIARYSQDVWKYGERVYVLIKEGDV